MQKHLGLGELLLGSLLNSSSMCVLGGRTRETPFHLTSLWVKNCIQAEEREFKIQACNIRCLILFISEGQLSKVLLSMVAGYPYSLPVGSCCLFFSSIWGVGAL